MSQAYRSQLLCWFCRTVHCVDWYLSCFCKGGHFINWLVLLYCWSQHISYKCLIFFYLEDFSWTNTWHVILRDFFLYNLVIFPFCLHLILRFAISLIVVYSSRESFTEEFWRVALFSFVISNNIFTFHNVLHSATAKLIVNVISGEFS